MKKILAVILAVAMLASLAVVCVSAEEKEWTPFGEVVAEYDKDVSKKITLDGDTSDWAAAGYQSYELDQYNFYAWAGEVGEDWHITTWFTADASDFYMAFKIYDPVVTASDYNTYNKDAFQIQLDFNSVAANANTEKDGCFERAVFYSFGYQEDGVIDMTVQCIMEEGTGFSEIDYRMRSDGTVTTEALTSLEDGSRKIQGKCRKMADGTGWEAEFAISWQTLFADAALKLAYADDKLPEISFAFDKDHPITLPMLICYLDCDESGKVTGAWGTFATNSASDWSPDALGAKFKLIVPDDADDVTLDVDESKAQGEIGDEFDISDQTKAETTAAETTAAETTAAPAVDTTAAAEGTTVADETTTAAAKAKSGCKSVIGAFAVIAVISLAGVSLKRKH